MRRRWTRRRRSAACTASSMLHAATLPFESNVALALVHDAGGENDRKLIAPAVAAYVNLYGRPELAAAQASRDAGNAPNAVLAAAAAIVGPRRQAAARDALKFMIERFHAAGLGMEFGASLSESFDIATVDTTGMPRADRRDARCARAGADRRASRRAADARCSCAGSRVCRATRPKPRCWRPSRPRWPGGR